MSFWENLFSDHRFKKRKSKSKKHAISVESTEKVSGVYKFPEEERTYIGQSENIAERLNQHLADEKLNAQNIDDIEFKEVEGDKLDREIEEQREINKKFGIEGGELTNLRNPLSEKRQEKYLGDE